MRRSWVATILCAVSIGSMVAPVQSHAGGHHRHRCVPYCCPVCPHRGYERDSRGGDDNFGSRGEAAPAPIIQAVPYFAMPMMYASMPMMPTMAVAPQQASSRSGSDTRGADDCCERLDKIEAEMLKLAKSVNDLQTIVGSQTEMIQKLHQSKQPLP